MTIPPPAGTEPVSPLRLVAVTGAAGYIGRHLCRHLAADPSVARVVAIDRQPPPAGAAGAPDRITWHRLDVSRDDLAPALQGVHAVLHLAFVLDSRVPTAVADRVDLEGTRRVLAAAVASGAARLVVASSVSAYGARPDNPARLRERDPLRAGPGLRYAHHKVLVEQLLDRFEREHPAVAVVRLRICVVLGPPPRPGAAAALLAAPVLALPRGFVAQFVHVDDLAVAFRLALAPAAHGPYNVAAEPPLGGAAIARETGQRYLPLPGALVAAGHAVARRLGLADPDRLAFVSHPIVVDSGRLRAELGWRPRHDAPSCLRALRAPAFGT